MELPMLHPQLEPALKLIGVDLSTLTPSQRTFLIESAVRLLQKHDLQWIKENSRLLRDRFDLLAGIFLHLARVRLAPAPVTQHHA